MIRAGSRTQVSLSMFMIYLSLRLSVTFFITMSFNFHYTLCWHHGNLSQIGGGSSITISRGSSSIRSSSVRSGSVRSSSIPISWSSYGVNVRLSWNLDINIWFSCNFFMDISLSGNLSINIWLSSNLDINIGFSSNLGINIRLSSNLDINISLSWDVVINIRLSSNLDINIRLCQWVQVAVCY